MACLLLKDFFSDRCVINQLMKWQFLKGVQIIVSFSNDSLGSLSLNHLELNLRRFEKSCSQMENANLN